MIAKHDMDQISETHLTFTCSKSIIETVEKDVNMFKVNNMYQVNKYQKVIDVVLLLVFLLLTLNIITPFSSVSIVEFEQVNVSWQTFSI